MVFPQTDKHDLPFPRFGILTDGIIEISFDVPTDRHRYIRFNVPTDRHRYIRCNVPTDGPS
jgi:hypothetical protein